MPPDIIGCKRLILQELVICTYNDIHTMYQFETKLRRNRRLKNRLRAIIQDAICGAVNGPGIDDRFRGGAEGRPRKTARPVNLQRPSTIFQRLAPRLNDLHKKRRLSRCSPSGCAMLSASWNPVSNAHPAENGTRPRSTNPPDAARVTWKTARSAASRTSCAWSTTHRRRNSSSPLSWNRRAASGIWRRAGIFRAARARGCRGLHEEHRAELTAILWARYS
jgi:hypothetical protein